jgi:putative GTP pyrophosphokinase
MGIYRRIMPKFLINRKLSAKKIIENYKKKYHIYENFTERIRKTLDDLLNNIVEYEIEVTTKSTESLYKKLIRKIKYEKLSDLTDLTGIRIVVKHLSDIEKVCEVIKTNFVIDEENSINKSEELDIDQFGYLSIHYVVSFPKQRLILPEYKAFKNLKAEIQVRTILQNIWAIISHELEYKVKEDIPKELRREIYRLSALFEVVDKILDDFMTKRNEYRHKMREEDYIDDEINLDSLRFYFNYADIAKYWEKVILEITGINKPIISPEDYSNAIEIAALCKLKSIKDLDKILIKAKGWGEDLFKKFFAIILAKFEPDDETCIDTITHIMLLLVATSKEEVIKKLQNKYKYYGIAIIMPLIKEYKAESGA